MKRCWIGAAALVVLLISGLLSSLWIQDRQEKIARQVEEAARAAEAGHWEQAGEAAAEARALWEKEAALEAVLSDHAPMDRVEDLFALLERALRRRDTDGAGDLCTRLLRTLETLAEDHKLSLKNLL